MKLLLFLLLVKVTSVLSWKSNDERTVPAQWMLQTLDHFNPQDSRVWKQRYFVSDKYFKEGGPVFLQFGGESSANPRWVTQGQTSFNYAKRYNAMNIMLEHRFYGQSHPTEDVSTENLRYFTSEQALADTANFIQYLKSKDPRIRNSKWIAFGGSYPGGLSAWMRLKYPHLIAGAVVSSAAMKAVVNYKDYLLVVERALGPECSAEIKRGTQQLSQIFQNSNEWSKITKLFNLCEEFSAANEKDISYFMSHVASNFKHVVQYNHDNRNFIADHPSNVTVADLCAIMADERIGSEMTRLAAVNQLLLNVNQEKCFDYKYDLFIKNSRAISWSNNTDGSRQWLYQTCVEFGFFQSSDLNSQPFGHYLPIEYFEQQCTDVFGSQFNAKSIRKGVDFTNIHYGGFDINVSNTIFVYGSLDPWHHLGLLNYTYANSKSIFIEGTAHCQDIYPDSPNDPKQLIAARALISDYIGEILSNS